jgi:tetratricopeptide (TPR) repeat protein
LAISYYERALKIDRKHTDSLFFLGWCYLGTSDDVTGEVIVDDVLLTEDERNKRAELAYRKLIRILHKEEPNGFHLCVSYYNYSIALALLGKDNDALDCCYHALEIRENYAPAYRQLASIKRNMGLYGEALKDCRRALNTDERAERSYNLLGLIQRSMGNSDEAVESFLEAIECNSRYCIPYLNLNTEYRQRHEYKKAIQILDTATESNPNFADFYYYYGVTYDAMDNVAKAAINYRKYLNLVTTKSPHSKEYIEQAHKRLAEILKPLNRE